MALDILYAYPEDSGTIDLYGAPPELYHDFHICTGTYICKAKNLVGEAMTTCSVDVESQKGLLLDTLDEQRLQKIKALESHAPSKPVEAELGPEKPVFLTPLVNLENLKEGDQYVDNFR